MNSLSVGLPQQISSKPSNTIALYIIAATLDFSGVGLLGTLYGREMFS